MVINNFESFYQSLTSDEIWTESVSGRHKTETFKEVCFKVFKLALSDPEQFKIIPVAEHRKHVVNVLAKILPDKPKGKPWHVVEAEKIEAKEKKEAEQVATYTKEHVDKCVAEFDEMLKNSPMLTAFPRVGPKEAAEKGGWVAPKHPAHKMTTAMEAYNKERKIAYYRYCFDPITRDKLPTWVEEEVYNAEFDRIMVKKKKHPNWEILKELED